MKDIASKLGDIVARQPDTPAVVDTVSGLTYAELDNWSNTVAARILEAAGTEPSVCIVVSQFDRLAIVGMLATLKTPHVFLALDPEIPSANIAAIAQDLNAGICLYTDASEATVRTAGLSVPTVKIDTLREGSVPVVPRLHDLERVACFKRSSGSTGGAKTAAYTSEAVLLDAELGTRILDLRPASKLAIVSTFDAALSAAAIMRGILSGATVMPVDLRFETPKDAARRLIEAGLTHVYCTPTAIRLLCRGLPEGDRFPELRSILLGGEKTTMADVRLLSKTTPPDSKLRSTFASSETQLVAHTTVALSGDVGAEDFTELNLADGVRIDILGDNGQPLPFGEHGRVRVVGKMVSLGYQGHVDPTVAAKFSTLEDGSRAYLTDDFGYVTEDNRVVLTSRTGREVKIRGRRVDLTELETWLMSQAGIGEAAVVVQPIGPGGEPRLAAFIRGVPGQFEGVAALRMQMQSELIASMQPTAIVLVDDLPHTPNQKIDRKALETDLSHLAVAADKSFRADGLVGQVADIWASVLNRNIAGPDDNFFELGGDSIAATVAAVMIEERLGVRVDTGFVYRSPVLSEQAEALDRIGSTSMKLPDRLLVPLTAASFDNLTSNDGPPRVFVISGAGGHVFPFAPLAEDMLPDWDLVGILHPGILESDQKLEDVEAYADRMGKAMKALQPEGPYYIMGYSFGGAVAHEIGRRLSDAGEKATVVIVDLPLPKLVSLLHKANLAKRDFRSWVRRKLVADALAPEPVADLISLLDDPDLNPTERARQAVSIEVMGRILDKYRPPESAAPTVLIKAMDTMDRLQAEDFGWGRVVPLEKVVLAPGNHLNLFKGPNHQSFADLLRENLAVLDKVIRAQT